MAIQKMEFVKIVGSIEDMHDVLKKLVLSEKLHFDFDSSDVYDNSFIIHEYEAMMDELQPQVNIDIEVDEAQCGEMEQLLERLCDGLGIKPRMERNSIDGVPYSIKDAKDDLDRLFEFAGPIIEEIDRKRKEAERYEQFSGMLDCIIYKDLNFDTVAALNYFDYELGALSRENRMRLRRNYENISAVALNIGTIQDSSEDIYIMIFPRQFREEIKKLLKALNWARLDIPEGLRGTVGQMTEQAKKRIKALKGEISGLTREIDEKRAEFAGLLNKIHTTLKLEEKILELEHKIELEGNTFVINAWVMSGDMKDIEDVLGPLLKKLIIEKKKPDELARRLMPPTQLKNNRVFRPFEKVVRLYGLPAYGEIDPTPFVAITFFLMFGVMFGDIGQGLVYLLAGLAISKKMRTIGQLLVRLGGSSIVFGFIYGSFFGLEKMELPWLPSLIGRPLDPRNIPSILIAGVAFGVAALTVSYIFGIVNAIRNRDIEEGIFGKNGIAGYIFMMSLVLSAVLATGVLKAPAAVPLSAAFLSLAAMIMKKPLANFVLGNRPLIHGKLGSYLTESIFEGVETILSTLSNIISFIRVGAFALNHAGLFLAFLVMSELMPGIVLKIFMLLLGNVVILSLEGLVVFIQGLRLQYYEMFGKYFHGGGVVFKPARLGD
ncbi:MAG: V-type ATP synthase subunit I [Bacillota bacterium]